MPQASSNNRLAERILSAGKRAILLRGPGGSGKSTAARTLVRRFRDDQMGRSRCLLLVPNYPAVRQARARLLDESPHGVIVSPPVLTFSMLAGRILAVGANPPQSLDGARRHLLLQSIITELASNGRLGDLAASADTPGLVSAVARAIAELKRGAVDPERLTASLRERQGVRGDLFRIYQTYQARLQEAGLVDVEGQMWLARDRLAEAGRGRPGLTGLDDIEALVVDGFTTFTPTQMDLLSVLAERVSPLVITLPLVEDGRDRMWHWTRRTTERIREAFGDGLAEFALSNDAEVARLSAVWERVFDPDAEPAGNPGLKIVAAHDEDAEVRAVARRVKALLMFGAPSGSVAVLARGLEPYAERIAAVFAEHDIPIACPPVPLAASPIVRFWLQAAAVAGEFAYADILAVLKNSYFRPEALGPFSRADAATAEMLIREGNVLAGREQIRQAAQRLIRRLESRTAFGDGEDADEEAPEAMSLGPLEVNERALAQATDLLERLLDAVEQATENGNSLELIDRLALRDAALETGDPALTARDLRCLDQVEAICAALPAPLRDMTALTEALQLETAAAPREESVVDVMDVLDARCLRWRHVFLLGMNEGRFPRPVAEDPLLRDTDRLALRRRGMAMDVREDLASQEMLLFYLSLCRADESITLSYPRREAGEASASPFLLAAAETLGGMDAPSVTENRTEIPAGRFLPGPAELSSRREASIAAVAGLFDPDRDPGRAASGWVASNRPELLARAGRSVYLHHRRWSPQPCGSLDGRITDADLLEQLSARFPRKTVFSASQLNAYADCPWRFFARYILHLEPLPKPERQLEAVSRGLFCHDVLYRTAAALHREHGAFAPDALDAEDIDRQLGLAVEQAAREVETRRPPYPVLWRIQRSEMHEALRAYLRDQMRSGPLHPVCMHFELAFGLEPSEALELSDPASQAAPVVIDTPAGPIRLRGKIDRVDRIEFLENVGLLAVDYKTGQTASARDLEEGRNVQLALYTKAIERLCSERSLGGVFHQIFDGKQVYFAAVKGGRYLKANPAFEQRLARVIEHVGEMVRGMSAGRFDLFPHGRCVPWCPYRQICGHSPARERLKLAGDASGREENA